MAQKATLVVLLLVFVGAIFIHYMLTNSEGFKNKKRGLGKRGSGKRRSGKRSPGKRRSGKRSPGKRGSGKRSPGKRGSGKRSLGKRGSGKRRSGKRRSGKRSPGKRSPGKRSPGKRSPGKRKSPKASTPKSNTTKLGAGILGAGILGGAGSGGAGGLGAGGLGAGGLGAGGLGAGSCGNPNINTMPNNNNCSASSNSGMNYSDIIASMLTPSLPDSRDLKDKLHAAVDTTIKGTNKITRECNKPRSNCAITVRNPISENNNICPGSNVLDLGDSIPYVANMSEYIKKDKIPCYGCNLK